MKCRTCREPAIIELPRHNANFCAEHFLQLCRRQVAKAIDDHDMFGKDDRLLVMVSMALATCRRHNCKKCSAQKLAL